MTDITNAQIMYHKNLFNQYEIYIVGGIYTKTGAIIRSVFGDSLADFESTSG